MQFHLGQQNLNVGRFGGARTHQLPFIFQHNHPKKSKHVTLAAKGCLFLETDGVVMDLHMEGHRVAFNKQVRVQYDAGGLEFFVENKTKIRAITSPVAWCLMTLTLCES